MVRDKGTLPSLYISIFAQNKITAHNKILKPLTVGNRLVTI